ncbi:uncharacterized protein LOC115321861 [Ixodes scapularis]|uniref:uncharacterized protein LOC115321861 n=1 Tax=Ixodes scapularis TaxID=6945 RepID=UPI001C37F6CF|nr:uncharacterized protein LOC115321861 [Ixodes scapularis]
MTAMLVTLAAALLTLGGVINAAHTHNTAAAYPELRPELGKYQEVWKCFPLKETWYLTYRSHETDPGFGGKAKCVKGSQTGPIVAGAAPLLLHTGGTRTNVTITPKSNQGYQVKNALQFKTPQGMLGVHIPYVDCASCALYRHPYITPGPACSVLVPESQLGKDTVCDFVFDLLCGTSAKYNIYEEGCK